MPGQTPDDAPEMGISAQDQAFMVKNATTAELYSPGPDATRQKDTPEGSITRFHRVGENIYPGTERDYWVYVPQQGE